MSYLVIADYLAERLGDRVELLRSLFPEARAAIAVSSSTDEFSPVDGPHIVVPRTEAVCIAGLRVAYSRQLRMLVIFEENFRERALTLRASTHLTLNNE